MDPVVGLNILDFPHQRGPAATKAARCKYSDVFISHYICFAIQIYISSNFLCGSLVGITLFVTCKKRPASLVVRFYFKLINNGSQHSLTHSLSVVWWAQLQLNATLVKTNVTCDWDFGFHLRIYLDIISLSLTLGVRFSEVAEQKGFGACEHFSFFLLSRIYFSSICQYYVSIPHICHESHENSRVNFFWPL